MNWLKKAILCAAASVVTFSAGAQEPSRQPRAVRLGTPGPLVGVGSGIQPASAATPPAPRIVRAAGPLLDDEPRNMYLPREAAAPATIEIKQSAPDAAAATIEIKQSGPDAALTAPLVERATLPSESALPAPRAERPAESAPSTLPAPRSERTAEPAPSTPPAPRTERTT